MQLNESLNKSNLSSPNQYMTMSIETIEEKIETFKELMEKYEKDNDYQNAELIKQQLIQATKAKDKKLLKETKFRHIQDKETLHSYENKEFIELNSKMNEKLEKLNIKFQKMESQLKQNQEEEMQKFQKNYEDKLKISMKPSNDLKLAHKKKDFFLKKKE